VDRHDPDVSRARHDLAMNAVLRREAGIAMFALLLLIAGLGVGLAALGTLWQTQTQREREAELLFIGEQFRQALLSYARASPPGAPRAPRELEDMLLDARTSPVTHRHLRRVYRDPFSGNTDWGLLRDAQGGIVGIFSQATGKPLKTANFPAALKTFTHAETYRQWLFAIDERGQDPTAQEGVAAGGGADTLAAGAAPGENAAAAGGLAPERTVFDRARVEHIVACQQAMERDFTACSSAARGDAGRLHACLDDMTSRHRECLAGG